MTVLREHTPLPAPLAPAAWPAVQPVTEQFPLWFGDPERPLFGWIHPPAGGKARSGVLLCPPLGQEQQWTYFALKALADRLAAAGHLVMRFDYEGNGDSSGDLGTAGTAGDWSASVRHALSVVRATGVERVAVVGLRMGALLALAGTTDTDALVLWDPCLSGKAFLREQRALGALTMQGNKAGDGTIEAPWAAWTPVLADSLRTLDVADIALPTVADVLVVGRSVRPRPDLLLQRFSAANVTFATTDEQENLLDNYPSALPADTIAAIAAWLTERAPATSPVVLPAPVSAAAVTAGRLAVTEQAVRLGPVGLFGMLAAAPHASGPVIVLVAGGTDHHVGPARMWVDLSRQWAADGARVLRLDLSGIGDSGVRPGQAREITYAPEAIDDIVTAATAISPDDPSNVILVGFCAGAYAVMEAALRLLPSAVIVLNPLPYFDPPESAAGSDHDTARRLSQNRPTWLRRVARNPLAQRTRSRTPEAVWRLLHHLRVLQSPAAGFAALVDGGVHLSVVCSADDAEVYVRMSGRELARLTRTRRFSFVADPELSHVLKSRYERERCADMLTERVRRARVESVPATAAGTLPSPVERRARPRP